MRKKNIFSIYTVNVRWVIRYIVFCFSLRATTIIKIVLMYALKHISMICSFQVMFLLLIFYCILGMSYSVYRDIVTNETYGGLWQVIVTRLPNALFGLSVTGLCSKSSQPFHTGQFWTKNNFSFTYSTKTTELIVYTIT